MNADQVAKVAVLGAGTMGAGIAQVAATAGCEVALYDVGPELLSRGLARIRDSLAKGVEKGKVTQEAAQQTLARVRCTVDLEDATRPADLVVEAVPELLEVKRTVFRHLSEVCRPDTVLATNTSSLSISKIAEAATHPERVVGMHFFNPPPLMKLLEVVRGVLTSKEVVDLAVALGRRFAKEPIVVKDSPGFASSRLGVALGLEAIRMVEEGVASVEDIDKAMELGYRHPMGPLRLTDLVGLDVRLAIAEVLEQELGTGRFKPPELLKRMAAEGKLGQKAGQGFYKWP